MAITLTQINALLVERGKTEVTTEKLFDALDYARGFYKVRASALNSDTPAEQLVLAVALLASQAPFTHAVTAALTSSEVTSASGASVKKDFADAPIDPYPVIGGLLAPFTEKRTSGISFGVSTR